MREVALETKKEEINLNNPDTSISHITNEIQRDLITESGVIEKKGEKGGVEWIMANSKKFREEFNKLLVEISQDEYYAEVINLMKNGDWEPLKEALLPIMRQRMK